MQFVILVVALGEEFLWYVAAIAIEAVGATFLFDQLPVEQYLLVFVVVDCANPSNVGYFAVVLPVLDLHYLLYTSDPEFVLKF